MSLPLAAFELTSFRMQGFIKTPTVEGLRAIVLLNMFWASWDSGKHLEAGLSYSTSAISAIWELEMVCYLRRGA